MYTVTQLLWIFESSLYYFCYDLESSSYRCPYCIIVLYCMEVRPLKENHCLTRQELIVWVPALNWLLVRCAVFAFISQRPAVLLGGSFLFIVLTISHCKDCCGRGRPLSSPMSLFKPYQFKVYCVAFFVPTNNAHEFI